MRCVEGGGAGKETLDRGGEALERRNVESVGIHRNT